MEGRTVLGDGGGVCQVSTTLFRAVLAAGLPVLERRAHSYRVGYYEQNSPPGFDATVYSPTTDFKFKNDTPAYILIQAKADNQTSTLIIELWGTNDGRIAKTTKPVITDQVPPPEDLYQDDPALRAGQIKQVDWKAFGAKVKFDYHVERHGEILSHQTFSSNYRPWQAVFLRGTGG
jgi:vancomycin resistance protein YoaR